MAYTPQTWNNNDPNTPLSATRLNYIEAGIANSAGADLIGTIDGSVPSWSANANAWVETPTLALSPRVLTLGKAGAISATETDNPDFYVAVPFNMTFQRMKVTARAAPTGSMVVQLRRSTNSGSSFADVSGFVCTFSGGAFIAIVDPADVDVSEGDLLSFSISIGSGSNLLIEAVGITR